MPITIFTDESGTHSNRYLVICAIVTISPEGSKRIKNVLRRHQAKLLKKDPSIDEIHASKINTSVKQAIINDLTNKHDYQVAYLVADKEKLRPVLRDNSNLCYNYLFKVLFKKLIMEYPNEDITIYADNRSVSAGSKNSLPEYIQAEAYGNWHYNGTLTIKFCDSRDVKGLQAVDVIANGVYAHYNRGLSHIYNLHSSFYSHRIKFPYDMFGS